ncbi:MAG TPA: amidohydrolase family protein [Aggregatilineales bacterium]|nr:amidohydrolase family protein [Aggregatilineales bacterium]
MLKIDAHHHFWNLNEVAYPWLGPRFEAINRTFEAADLEPILKEVGIARTVVVQAADSYEDTAYMLKVSDTHEWIGAVIGWVNLLDPDETARRLEMYTRHPKFRGIRHLIHNEPDAEWILQPRVIESLKVVAKFGVLFEVPDAYPRHLKQVPTILERVSDLKVVIDHLAKPPIRARQMADWDSQLKAVATSKTTWAKVSGLNTAADHANWAAADLMPYVDFALQCFSADRLMFGSDWPVCLLAGDYRKVFQESAAVLERYSQAEREAIWGKTAARIYNLNIKEGTT